MKKIISLLLALVLCFGLCACGTEPQPETTESTLPTKPPVTEPEPVQITVGQKVTAGENSFTINKVIFEDFNFETMIRGRKESWVASSGNDFFVIEVTIHNESRKDLNDYGFPTFVLNYDNGYDKHTLEGDWKFYEGSTYFGPSNLSPQESETYLWCTLIPEAQRKDTASPMVLEIQFMNEEFLLDINNK